MKASNDEKQALAQVSDLNEKYSVVLGGVPVSSKAVDLGEKGVWFRLLAGPLPSKEAATELCNKLKGAGLWRCLVRSEATQTNQETMSSGAPSGLPEQRIKDALRKAEKRNDSADATDLSAYVGKYPSDKIQGLYQLEDINADYIAKFGIDRWSTLLSYHVQSPIVAVDDEKLGRLLVTSQCRPHMCPNHAVVIFKVTGSVLGTCFTEEDTSMNIKTLWLGTGWRRTLAGEPCNPPGGAYWRKEEAKTIVRRFKQLAAQ